MDEVAENVGTVTAALEAKALVGLFTLELIFLCI